MRYKIPAALFVETFNYLRRCGGGRRECQVLWVSSWAHQELICEAIHPDHLSRAGGFELASGWLSRFWLDLARAGLGIRVQVHTHPAEAFHSRTDDEYPIVHSVGFLSLVIPNFARGPVGFEDAYLAEITPNGDWREVPPGARLEILK